MFTVCMLEKDPGPCQASFYRWYFNSETGRCEEFSYGGCLGNGNRFISKLECEETCDRLLVKEPVGMKSLFLYPLFLKIIPHLWLSDVPENFPEETSEGVAESES